MKGQKNIKLIKPIVVNVKRTNGIVPFCIINLYKTYIK